MSFTNLPRSTASPNGTNEHLECECRVQELLDPTHLLPFLLLPFVRLFQDKESSSAVSSSVVSLCRYRTFFSPSKNTVQQSSPDLRCMIQGEMPVRREERLECRKRLKSNQRNLYQRVKQMHPATVAESTARSLALWLEIFPIRELRPGSIASMPLTFSDVPTREFL